MSTTVTVTAEHIANGVPGSGWGCAIVLAIEDTFPKCEDASVGEVTASLFFLDDEDAYGGWANFDLPDEACEFIRRFDAGQPVEPFAFIVDDPEVVAA